ncbi:probable serine/threonine-protein kinase DDB_G0280133 [Ruditapes philippinarum]|uniref:probable serine/threonine-protein kinase DDB_G0280133 n=1 Tax=Ruditapes philippinarum TaxID=129788 RepID=UPI00295AAD83|nr:probable serine/threonine-protein kinase DDB_G0280133 [Ruditapes philippinarum]
MHYLYHDVLSHYSIHLQTYIMIMFILSSAILGILEIIQVHAELSCIECDHIDWNETLTHTSAHYIYFLLQDKYNPACALENPRDRYEYEQYFLRLQKEQQQQQQQQQRQQQQQQQRLTWQNYKQRYDVTVSICHVQCTYVFGDVDVYLQPFQETIKLNMHWRSCLNKLTAITDGCYERDTNNGYKDITAIIHRKLQFLGDGVVGVKRFKGYQCYCSSNFCYPTRHSSSDKSAISLSLLIVLNGYFIIK